MPQQFRLILKNVDAAGFTNDIDCYMRNGGYETLKKALAIAPKDLPDGKKMSPQEQLRDDVKLSGLRGRGGAGFPTGLKWTFLPKGHGGPVYLCVNCDESEPCTFNNRYLIECDPHQVLEGIILASYASCCQR